MFTRRGAAIRIRSEILRMSETLANIKCEVGGLRPRPGQLTRDIRLGDWEIVRIGPFGQNLETAQSEAVAERSCSRDDISTHHNAMQHIA